MSDTQSPRASTRESARASTHRQQLQMTQELEEALSVYSSNKDKKLDELREIVASQYVEHIDELDYYSKYHLIGLIIRNAIYKTEVPLLKNSAIQFWNNVALTVKKLTPSYYRSNLFIANAEIALKTAMAKDLMTVEALEEELYAEEAERDVAEEAERARARAVREAEMNEEREKKRQAAEAKKQAAQAAWEKVLRKPVRNGIVSTIRTTLTQPKIKTVGVVRIGGKRKHGKQTRKRRRKSTQHK